MEEDRSGQAEFGINLLRPEAMTTGDWEAIFEVFEASYREANRSYLEHSIQRIGLLALAFDAGNPCAYSVSNFRWMDLPGFEEPQLVVLHGMRCVNPSLRHRGLSGLLARKVSDEMQLGISASGRTVERQLQCGRHGHASGTGGRPELGTVPRWGHTPTEWQQAVGLKVAEAFGSNLDPTTFVCVGPGTPIGYPNQEFEATEAELGAWAPVNRARGDNLLVMNWTPTPPPGWVESV